MDKKKLALINYSDGFILDEEVVLRNHKVEKVQMSCTKRYYNCLYLLAGLSPCARNLMDFLAERMDENNLIRSDTLVRTQFIEFFETITQGDVIYKDSTVKAAFQLLSQKGLIILQSKGVFKVNPKYFFNGDDKDRIKEIVMQIKINSTEEFTLKDIVYK